MSKIQVNVTGAESFVSANGLEALKPDGKAGMEKILEGTGLGNDFLGWVKLPTETSNELLDNGPLRFTLRLVYPDTMGVRETRLITLDAGEYLNRTVVTYEGLADTTAIVAGLVVHEQNPDGYAIEADSGYLAYADLTQNADADNGVIYVGVVAPQADSMMMLPLAEPVGDAIGHLVARGKYAPGTEYVYYWGSGWSKGFMPDWESWRGYLSTFSRRMAQPLVTTVK